MTEHVELWLRSVSSWAVGRSGTFVDDLEALARAAGTDGERAAAIVDAD